MAAASLPDDVDFTQLDTVQPGDTIIIRFRERTSYRDVEYLLGLIRGRIITIADEYRRPLEHYAKRLAWNDFDRTVEVRPADRFRPSCLEILNGCLEHLSVRPAANRSAA